MEAERKRKLARRNPLSDCTNTSSSSVSLNPTKPNLSYSSSAPKKTTTRFNSATNLKHVSNPNSPPPTLLSTPSPKNGNFDLEASEPFSAVQGGRSFSNIWKDKGKEVAIPVNSIPILDKRKDKGKEVAIPESSTPILSKRSDKEKEVALPVSSTPILNKRKEFAIPVSSTPNLSERKDKGKEVAIPVSSTPILSKRNDEGTFDLEASEPFSAVYSLRSFSNRRKNKEKEVATPESSTHILSRSDKGKEVAIPASSTPILSKRNDKGKEVAIPVSNTPILKVSDNREKSDGVEGANLPKTKALTDPGRKKHRAVSSERDVFRDPASNKRKDRGKEVAIPVSSTPILKVSDSRERNHEVEGENLTKAKAMTAPCKKKQRTTFEDPLLQDYIEQQRAYFKLIDEFELPVEEV